jgi:hypothetical protein
MPLTMLLPTVLQLNQPIHTLVSRELARLMVVPSRLSLTLTFQRATAMPCKQLLLNNQHQSVLMLRPGNSTAAESSLSAVPLLTTESWQLDTHQLSGSLRTLGEYHGECRDTLNLSSVTPALFATKPLTQILTE